MDTSDASGISGHTPDPDQAALGQRQIGDHLRSRWRLTDAVPYAAEDADITLRLWQTFQTIAAPERSVTTVYETLERPLVPVLAQMEMRNGIKVDRDTLSAACPTRLPRRWRGWRRRSTRLAGRDVQCRLAPSSWAKSCLTRWGCEGGKRGKTGAYATGRRTCLKDLATEHDLPARLMLDWRQLSQAEIDLHGCACRPISIAETGRVHTSPIPSPGRSTGPAGLDRSEPAEHPGAHGGRPAHSRGVRGGCRVTCW